MLLAAAAFEETDFTDSGKYLMCSDVAWGIEYKQEKTLTNECVKCAWMGGTHGVVRVRNVASEEWEQVV